MATTDKEQPLAQDELDANPEDDEDDDELSSQATTSRGTTPSDCPSPSPPPPDTQVGESEARGSPLHLTAK